jgi:choloylglycine hydrolase
MKKVIFEHFVAIALFAAILVGGSVLLFPCSTFLLKDGKTLLVGHNLDERTHFPGAVFINKRGVSKSSVSYAALMTGRSIPGPTLTWTSRYASLTFNAFGRDFPDDGMNEAGLFVGEMSYPPSKFPEDPAKPRIFICLWLQHLLDTCETVDQVIASASAMTIDGWGWHFFAADRTGAVAAIEFLDGKVVIHRGAAMPVPVLCNEPYDFEMRRREAFLNGPEGDPVSTGESEIPRFVQAEDMIKHHEKLAPGERKPAVDYAFAILNALERGGTQWSFVCDLNKQEAWFKTAGTPRVKHVALGSFKKGCDKPVKFLDMNSDFAGKANARFESYSLAANRKIIEQALAAILRISPDFEKKIEQMGETREGLIARFAAYPETTKCSERAPN